MSHALIYTAPPLAFATTFLCALGLPSFARADSLQNVFMSMPKDKRIAVKKTLSRYQLFVGRIDESWTPGTERALRRGAEEIALRSSSYSRPRLNTDANATIYIEKLQNGDFSDYFQKEAHAQLWSFLNLFSDI